MMKKFTCSVCGYTHEGDSAPDKCPQCGASADKFKEAVEGEMAWADERLRNHVTSFSNGESENLGQFDRK